MGQKRRSVRLREKSSACCVERFLHAAVFCFLLRKRKWEVVYVEGVNIALILKITFVVIVTQICITRIHVFKNTQNNKKEYLSGSAETGILRFNFIKLSMLNLSVPDTTYHYLGDAFTLRHLVIQMTYDERIE